MFSDMPIPMKRKSIVEKFLAPLPLKTVSRIFDCSLFLKILAMTYDLTFKSMKSEATILGNCFIKFWLITNSKQFWASRIHQNHNVRQSKMIVALFYRA